MTHPQPPTLVQAVIPILFLIGLLFLNVLYFEDPLGGANQIALMITATLSGLIAWHNHVDWNHLQGKILSTIHSAMPAILILLLIGLPQLRQKRRISQIPHEQRCIFPGFCVL